MFVHELDTVPAPRQCLDELSQVIQIAGQPVHAVHHERVPFARQRPAVDPTVAGGDILTGRFVDKHPVHHNLVQLAVGVLIDAAHPDISDALCGLVSFRCGASDITL